MLAAQFWTFWHSLWNGLLTTLFSLIDLISVAVVWWQLRTQRKLVFLFTVYPIHMASQITHTRLSCLHWSHCKAYCWNCLDIAQDSPFYCLYWLTLFFSATLSPGKQNFHICSSSLFRLGESFILINYMGSLELFIFAWFEYKMTAWEYTCSIKNDQLFLVFHYELKISFAWLLTTTQPNWGQLAHRNWEWMI